jgi:hypothetical protein
MEGRGKIADHTRNDVTRLNMAEWCEPLDESRNGQGQRCSGIAVIEGTAGRKIVEPCMRAGAGFWRFLK